MEWEISSAGSARANGSAFCTLVFDCCRHTDPRSPLRVVSVRGLGNLLTSEYGLLNI